MFDGVGNFQLDDARIRKPGALDFSTGTPHPSLQPFDAEKILVRILRCDGREKRAVAAAEVDFNGRGPPEHRAQIQRLKTIGRDELDLACYR